MNFIYLKKTGFYTRFKKKYIPIDRSISYYLQHYPKVAKDFTVADLMNLLKKWEADIDFLFESYTRGFLLQPFYEELNLPKNQEKQNDISILEFSWSADVYNEKEFGKPLYSVSNYVHISGIVKDEKEKYSLSFTPLNLIKNATFKLNKKYKVSYFKMGEIWEEDRKPENINFFKGIKEFTLQDFIGAFLNEISFSGYPESRNQEVKKLDKISQRLKDGIEKTFSMEEVQLKFKTKFFKELQKKKETKKNLLRLAKLKKEIAFLKDKIAKS
ncbi:MAG: hypothetical protein WDZ45_00545 [Flavobacteriaceae bacterium]